MTDINNIIKMKYKFNIFVTTPGKGNKYTKSIVPGRSSD